MTDRKRLQSQTERDMEGIAARRERERRNAPARGVPVDGETGSFEPEDHFTPIDDALEGIGGRIVLTERERMLFQLLWRHTANMEMRARKRSDSQDSAQLRRELDDVQLAIADIHGASGSNGKLGKINERIDTLKERLDKLDGRRWGVIMWLAGLVFTVVTAAVAIGVWKGSVDTDLRTLKERAFRRSNVQPPEWPATKEATP